MEPASIGRKKCPYCAEEVRAEARRCSHCGSWIEPNPLRHEWYRSPDGKIAGACAGLAEEFRISVTLVRLLFVLAALCWGSGLLVYVALWIVMPKRPETRIGGSTSAARS